MSAMERVLRLYIKLMQGKKVSKSELAQEFGVNEKTIQRDIELLRGLSADKSLLDGKITYDKKVNAYSLQLASRFSKKEILAISKIILEVRAFNKQELDKVLDGLLSLLSGDDAKAISRLIAVERDNYRPLTVKEDRFDKIWDLSEYLRHQNMLFIDYRKPRATVSESYDLLPRSLFFDNHYFYLRAFSQQAWEKEPRDSLRTFRIDRILDWSPSSAQKPPHKQYNRMLDTDEQNHQVDAYSGALRTIKISYTEDPDNILDTFPDSKILNQSDEECEIEIITQDTLGLDRRLMAEMDALTVLSPPDLVKRISERIEEMKKNYR